MTNNSSKAEVYFGKLSLFHETGMEATLWALQEDDALLKARKPDSTDSYDGLHTVENGDTLLVGVQKEDFCNSTADEFKVIDAYYRRFDKDPIPPRMKFWDKAYSDILFDRRITLPQIDNHTVKGFPQNEAPEAWFDMFKNEFTAVLIKKPTPV